MTPATTSPLPSPARARALQTRLLAWYADNRRDLPWRRTTDPYAILVSEIMLQQTQVPRVVPRFVEWLAAWPDLESLAAAPLADVLRRWQGLGYNNRARRLQECAAAAVGRRAGRRPGGAAAHARRPARAARHRPVHGARRPHLRPQRRPGRGGRQRAPRPHPRARPARGPRRPGAAGGGRRRAAARPQPRLAQRAHGLRLAGAHGAQHRHRLAQPAGDLRGLAAAEAGPPAAPAAPRRAAAARGPGPVAPTARPTRRRSSSPCCAATAS